MSTVRTTVTFQSELFEALKGQYRELGFSTLGDLVNQAVRDYLRQRTLQEKHEAMARAAASSSYRALLAEISEDWALVDAQVPDY